MDDMTNSLLQSIRYLEDQLISEHLPLFGIEAPALAPLMLGALVSRSGWPISAELIYGVLAGPAPRYARVSTALVLDGVILPSFESLLGAPAGSGLSSTAGPRVIFRGDVIETTAVMRGDKWAVRAVVQLTGEECTLLVSHGLEPHKALLAVVGCGWHAEEIVVAREHVVQPFVDGSRAAEARLADVPLGYRRRIVDVGITSN